MSLSTDPDVGPSRCRRWSCAHSLWPGGIRSSARRERAAMEAMLRGVLIGLSVAVPPGPNAALCVSRTLAGGRSAGFRCGMGAASGQRPRRLCRPRRRGCTPRLQRVQPRERPLSPRRGPDPGRTRVALGPGPHRSSTTIRRGRVRDHAGPGPDHPLTLLYFTATMALGTFRPGEGPLVVAGVFAGSAAWWAALATATAALGHHLDERRLSWANRLVAAVIAGAGLVSVACAL